MAGRLRGGMTAHDKADFALHPSVLNARIDATLYRDWKVCSKSQYGPLRLIFQEANGKAARNPNGLHSRAEALTRSVTSNKYGCNQTSSSSLCSEFASTIRSVA